MRLRTLAFMHMLPFFSAMLLTDRRWPRPGRACQGPSLFNRRSFSSALSETIAQVASQRLSRA